MSELQRRIESAYDACRGIGALRTAFPRCWTAVPNTNSLYCVRDGALWISQQQQQQQTDGDKEAEGDVRFVRADAFYAALRAWEQRRGGAKEKKLSLEEELAAERLRASTTVDISSCAGIACEVSLEDSSSSGDGGPAAPFFLLVSKPGVGWLLWREGSSDASAITDFFGDEALLKPQMPSGAQMDLQLVHCKRQQGGVAFAWTFVAASNVYFASFTLNEGGAGATAASAPRVVPLARSDAVEYGTPDFILAEEFSLYTSTWLSCDKRRIAFSACDVSPLASANCLRPDGTVETIPYAFVNTKNVRFNLVVADLPLTTEAASSSVVVVQPVRILPFAALKRCFGWIEYVVRVLFVSDDEVLLTLLSRDQMRSALVVVPVAALPLVADPAEVVLRADTDGAGAAAAADSVDVPASAFRVVKTTEAFSRGWIDINDETRVLPSPSCADDSSEKQQQQQNLRLMTVGQEVTATKPGFFEIFVSSDGGGAGEWTPLLPEADLARLLPRGIVGTATRPVRVGGALWILARAFFPACPGTRLVAISAAGSGAPARVVQLSGAELDVTAYSVVGSNDAEVIFSGIFNQSPARAVETLRINLEEALRAGAAPAPTARLVFAAAAESSGSLPPRSPVLYFTVPIADHAAGVAADGEPLQAALLLPSAPDQQQRGLKTPLLVYSYSGPHVSVVTPTFIAASAAFELWRRMGFAVLVTDGRMATRHSLAANSRGKYSLGEFEAADVAACVKHLEQRHDEIVGTESGCCIDFARVGFHGASYGGYLALLCIATQPTVFRIVVASAPVTRWLDYTSGYTERYMGLPGAQVVVAAAANAGTQNSGSGSAADEKGEQQRRVSNDAYARPTADLPQLAQSFPDETGRCVIHHGLCDENVHLTHTQRLVQALSFACKPYSFLAFPGERHGLRKDARSTKYAAVMTVRAFAEALLQ